MRNVCGEMGSFGEHTHWAKDSWYSGDARDAGVLKDLTLCSVNSRKSSYVIMPQRVYGPGESSQKPFQE